MRTRLYFIVMASGIFLGMAQAHEGEQHAQPQVAAVPMPGESLLAEAAVSETFELVVKHSPITPRKEETLKIFLTDFGTNAPIEKANIEIHAKGPLETKATASETEIHGIYEAKISFPQKGDYSLVFNIISGELADTLIIDKFSIDTGHSRSRLWRIFKTVVIWIFILGLFVGIAVFIWRNKHVLASMLARYTGSHKSLTLALVVSVAGWPLLGHEGESHGPELPAERATALTGSPIHLSKESQFLLGVRTFVATPQELKKRVSALGHVVPRSQGKADVVSLQAGRLIVDEHYKLPQIGDRVKKGQIVAEIEVIDSFHVAAPISGVITEVNYTAGEWIEQGKKLLVIVESTVVWVEASIFESDLPAVEGSRQAFIKTQTYPEREFKGKLITLGKMLDPETRSVKAVFEVANPDEKLRPGMFVDVAIETKASEETLAVPSSAILDKDGQRVAFIKTGPETFVMRPVEAGGQYGDLAAIKSGLAEGERVVIVGNYQLLTTPPMAVKSK